ncbi:type II toxin-antitoxin system VapC family toxin [Bernardetia sp. OM2101]|uniref:type II toxin-antitoxin system VapC family toxin n=1 Tax=Bernardetia sp. OM2101 TaxID=3344876 RepID=UPI0035D0ED0F
MNILLDTHALIWFFEGDKKLSNKARKTIQEPKNTIFVSVVSFWEIVIKISIDKLEMDLSMEELQKLVWENGIQILPIKIEHTFLLRNLPYFHKDPFDRLLFVQASSENMNLVSCDVIFDDYLDSSSISRIW